jgi:hypothetical protein
MIVERRRFPPPWGIEEANTSCFIVKDNNGQALAYVYFESDPGRRTAANLLTRDEARRIAANVAKPSRLKPSRDHDAELVSSMPARNAPDHNATTRQLKLKTNLTDPLAS